MKKYIQPLTVALAGLMLGSCSDFLEPKSSNEFTPKDAQSLNEILLGEAYPGTTGRNQNNNVLEAFIHLMDDDVAMAPYQEPHRDFNIDVYRVPFTWQPELWRDLEEAGEDTRGDNMYYSYYQFILGCNAIMDYIDQAQNDTQDDINNVLAQAYTLRGFFYLQLVNIFGAPYNYDSSALGVPLKLNSGIENNPLTRNTVDEVYKQIISDLEMAIRLYESLPAARQWKADYRTSLPMAQLLLSRTYLYMEDWANAALYAEKVMNNPNFSLVDLNNVEYALANGNPVFVNYTVYDQCSECIWPYGRVADTCMWLTEYKTEGARKIHSYFKASPELMATFDDTDLRKQQYVVTSTFVEDNGERMPQAFGKVSYDTRDYIASGGTSSFGRSLRLSEAYLNYAEARANMPGGETDALAALNTLRKKRFAPADYEAVGSMGADECRQFVRDERRRELCFEGHRWFDLRRWGMPEIKHVWYVDDETTEEYVLAHNDPQYILPFPLTSLEANPELVQNEQGPSPRPGNSIGN